MKSKIISRAKARQLRATFDAQGKTLVFTNGCFDVLHVGHVRYLQEARKHGDALMVGLNTDSSVQILKGPSRPINAERARAEVLAALEMVDYVVLFPEETPLKLISSVKPHVLAKGADYQHGEIVGEDVVKALGGTVRRIRLQKGYSTTATVKKMRRKS